MTKKIESNEATRARAAGELAHRFYLQLVNLDFNEVELPAAFKKHSVAGSAAMGRVANLAGLIAAEYLSGHVDLTALESMVAEMRRPGGGAKPRFDHQAIDRIKAQPFWVSFDVSYPASQQSTVGRAIDGVADTHWFGGEGHMQREDSDAALIRHTVYLGSHTAGSPGMVGLTDIIKDVRRQLAQGGATVGDIRANAGIHHIQFHPMSGWKLGEAEQEIRALGKKHGIDVASTSYNSNVRGRSHSIELWYGSSSPEKLAAFNAELKAYVEKQRWPLAEADVIQK